MLAGTYELLHLWESERSVGPRSHDIHFGRHHLERAADREHFLRVLVSFEQQLPAGTNLLDVWEMLYERSIGCVGIVKDWLTLAYRAALKGGAATVSPEHLERTAPAADKTWRQRRANLGERRLSARTEARTRLRVALGLEDPKNDGSAASARHGRARDTCRCSSAQAAACNRIPTQARRTAARSRPGLHLATRTQRLVRVERVTCRRFIESIANRPHRAEITPGPFGRRGLPHREGSGKRVVAHCGARDRQRAFEIRTIKPVGPALP